MGTRISKDNKRKTATANQARDQKWNAVMANKAQIANAAMVGAQARKTDSRSAVEQMALQDHRQVGVRKNTRLQGQNQLANTRLQGQNQVTNTAAQGGQNRLTNTGQNQFAAGQAEQANIYAKEGDNRKFVTQAMQQGAPMTEQSSNAFNTPGEHNVDIAGMQVPQKAAPVQNAHFVAPKFDNEGVMREGTGVWTMPPAQQTQKLDLTKYGLSPNFDPKNPSPEDYAAMKTLQGKEGGYDMIRQLEAHFSY